MEHDSLVRSLDRDIEAQLRRAAAARSSGWEEEAAHFDADAGRLREERAQVLRDTGRASEIKSEETAPEVFGEVELPAEEETEH